MIKDHVPNGVPVQIRVGALCSWCNEPVKVGKPGASARKHCSLSCAAKSQWAARSAETGINYKVHGICKCGAKVENQNRVCSACSTYKRGHRRIEGVWQPISTISKMALFDSFKGSIHGKWLASNNYIHDLARRAYKRSDQPKECAVCGSYTVDIAHKKAVSSFPGEASLGEINHLDNLIALCPTHHREQERGLTPSKD